MEEFELTKEQLKECMDFFNYDDENRQDKEWFEKATDFEKLKYYNALKAL